MVDTSPERLRALQDRLELRGVTGNGIQPSVLREAVPALEATGMGPEGVAWCRRLAARAAALRSVFQRACRVPLPPLASEPLWRAYEAFEGAQADRTLAKRALDDILFVKYGNLHDDEWGFSENHRFVFYARSLPFVTIDKNETVRTVRKEQCE